MSAVLRSSVGWGCPLACMSCSCRLITARSVHWLGLLHGCVDCLGNSKPCVWLCSLVRGLRLQGVPFAAMRQCRSPYMTSKGITAGFTFPFLSKTSICNRNLQLPSKSTEVPLAACNGPTLFGFRSVETVSKHLG